MNLFLEIQQLNKVRSFETPDKHPKQIRDILRQFYLQVTSRCHHLGGIRAGLCKCLCERGGIERRVGGGLRYYAMKQSKSRSKGFNKIADSRLQC